MVKAQRFFEVLETTIIEFLAPVENDRTFENHNERIFRKLDRQVKEFNGTKGDGRW